MLLVLVEVADSQPGVEGGDAVLREVNEQLQEAKNEAALRRAVAEFAARRQAFEKAEEIALRLCNRL